MTEIPLTPAIQVLQKHQVAFKPHFFRYEDRGGTKVSSRELGVSEFCIIKTLVMETDAGSPLIVLMHGSKQVSTVELARVIGVKSIRPCSPKIADHYSGYQIGGTSPFGTREKMPIYMQKTILDLDLIFINGGGRGFLVSLEPQEVVRVLKPTLVDVAADFQ